MKKLVHDNRRNNYQPLNKPGEDQETNTVKEVELPERETETKKRLKSLHRTREVKRTPQKSWNCEKDKRRPKKQAESVHRT